MEKKQQQKKQQQKTTTKKQNKTKKHALMLRGKYRMVLFISEVLAVCLIWRNK